MKGSQLIRSPPAVCVTASFVTVSLLIFSPSIPPSLHPSSPPPPLPQIFYVIVSFVADDLISLFPSLCLCGLFTSLLIHSSSVPPSLLPLRFLFFCKSFKKMHLLYTFVACSTVIYCGYMCMCMNTGIMSA